MQSIRARTRPPRAHFLPLFFLVPGLAILSVGILVAGTGRLEGLYLIGAAALLLLVAYQIYRRRSRRETILLEDLGDGFRVESWKRTAEFGDECVREIAVDESTDLSHSHEWAILRTLRLRVSNGPETDTFVLFNRILCGQPDPLRPLTNRLVGQLVARIEYELAAGETFAGENWRLAPAGFAVAISGAYEFIRFNQLTHLEVRDRTLRCWMTGRASPFCSMSLNSWNALPLSEFLSRQFSVWKSDGTVDQLAIPALQPTDSRDRQLSQHPDSERGPVPSERDASATIPSDAPLEFGRLLCAYNPPKPPVAVSLFVILVLSLPLVVQAPPMWFLFAIRAGIVVAAAISFVVVTLFYPRIRMEWYEHGFRRIRGNRVQTILYQQLGQLTYYAVHQYLQQIKRTYVCTRYTLVLLPDPDAGIPVISTWKNSK